MERILHRDPENTYMFRKFGLVPSQARFPNGRRVCYTHDYQDPGESPLETCAACGFTRHVDSEI